MADKKLKADRALLCENMNYAAKESFIRLRTNILFSFVASEGCKIIGVTSSRTSEGKSTTSVNLAYSLAQLGKKVLLVDCDMRRPSLNEKLGFSLSPGLSNLLTNINVVGETVAAYTPSDNSSGFFAISAGDIPPNPSELLNSGRMAKLLGTMRTVYDYILLDLPPVGAVADAQTISGLTDGMLIVVKDGSCPKNVLASCMQQLELAKCHILGFVLNGTIEGSAKKYSKDYYYYKK
ncbi:MAG: CpsD/CapB family tyrosine-protein kinase [Eubacteriales bacterium]|nr:CpsD/CapB family tyrosine-protein kinase [Eubacteriales bacterium]